jgi:hypothetical protein
MNFLSLFSPPEAKVKEPIDKNIKIFIFLIMLASTITIVSLTILVLILWENYKANKEKILEETATEKK